MKQKDDTDLKVAYIHKKVKGLIAQNKSEEDIATELEKEGVDRNYTFLVIANLEDDAADKKSFRNSMIMGGFYLLTGLLLNCLSYKIAVNISAFFFYLFWGIIVLGIITIVKGFVLYRK